MVMVCGLFVWSSLWTSVKPPYRSDITNKCDISRILGDNSISHKTSYRKISQSLEGARSVVSFPIAFEFGRRLGSIAARAPAKFQSDTKILTSDLNFNFNFRNLFDNKSWYNTHGYIRDINYSVRRPPLRHHGTAGIGATYKILTSKLRICNKSIY